MQGAKKPPTLTIQGCDRNPLNISVSHLASDQQRCVSHAIWMLQPHLLVDKVEPTNQHVKWASVKSFLASASAANLSTSDVSHCNATLKDYDYYHELTSGREAAAPMVICRIQMEARWARIEPD